MAVDREHGMVVERRETIDRAGRQSLDRQNKILEQIATGAPLSDVLTEIVRLVENQARGLRASILLLDAAGRHLRHGAAPSLPEAYNAAIDGLAIGPAVGSCGTAAYRGEPVVVTDIAHDPLWADFAELALSHGLRACWSTPIRSAAGEVLGTFAMYYREPRAPTADEVALTETATHLVGIALERHRAEAAREELIREQAARSAAEQAEAQIESILGRIADAFVALDQKWQITYLNPAGTAFFEQALGLSVTELLGRNIWEIAPDAINTRFYQEYCRALNEQITVEFEEFYPPIDSWLEVHVYPSSDGLSIYFRDVSERKRAEAEHHRLLEQVERDRKLLEAVVRQMPAGVIIAEAPSGRLVLGNDQVEQIWRHEFKPADGVAEYAEWAGFHSDGRQYTGEEWPLARAITQGEIVTAEEIEFRRGDGTRGLLSVSASPIRDPAGEIIAGVASFTDITEPKQIERERLERSRQALVGAEVGAALTSADPLSTQLRHCTEAIVQHLDAAFARIWTLDAATNELVLQASSGLYTHLDGAHGRIPVGQFKIGQIAQARQPHLTNTVIGDPRVSDQAWAEREGMVAFAGYPLQVEDQLIGVLALFARQALSDATLAALGSVASEIALGIAREWADQERAELLRREQAARAEVETINRVGQLLTAELDLERVVQAVTEATTELTGAQFGAFFYNVNDDQGEAFTLYTIAGVSREHFSQFPMPRNTDLFGPTFRGEGIVRLADVRQDPRFGRNPPYYGMPAGHRPVVSYLAIPVISRTGEVIGGLFFGHSDAGVFTEREERIVTGLIAQAAIAMDNARLYQEAQSALRVRDEFLGAAAHDLKTPLAVVKASAQLLQRQAARPTGLNPQRLATMLTGLDLATTKMTRMVDQLLDIARINSGRPLDLEPRPTDLLHLVQRAVFEHQQTTERHQIEFATTAESVVGAWDPGRLERVIDNLLGNAVKYSPLGGTITLRVTTETDATGHWAVLSVEDAGVGIPEADLHRIFDRFQRGGNVTGIIPGTGIGLASARQIVEWHNGQISAESREGAGSTFRVRLPLAPEATTTAPADAPLSQ